MNNHAVSVLEFENIREEIISLCRTEEGKDFTGIQNIYTDAAEQKKMLKDSVECRVLLEQGENEPRLYFPKIIDYIPHLEKEGTVFDASEVNAVVSFIESGNSFLVFIRRCVKAKGKSFLSENIPQPVLKDCVKKIRKYIDKDGTLKEKEIPELKRIADRIGRIRQAVSQIANSYFTEDAYSGHWQTNVPAQRSGRTVLPLKANYRGKIKGIVHEVSSSGATLFIEPMEIVEKNNQLSLQENLYNAEVQRILRELTSIIREESGIISGFIQDIVFFDIRFARARYSLMHHCTAAEYSESEINLIKAFHPLLGDKCIPVSLFLDKEKKILIISGPNTGGKTVTLKTLGLLALMNQFGMEIPAGEGTALPVFSEIFVDIGDEQSIQNSLSTFSGHIMRLSQYIKAGDENSLVLLDELGSGTDSEEGSALAMAVLDEFLKKKSFVVTTTHQNLIKNYAYSTPGVQNASMEFDNSTLTPTFKLHIGIPGESHALAIARRNGLSDSVIDTARSFMETGRAKISDMLKELHSQLRIIENERAALAEKTREILRRESEIADKQEAVKEKENILKKEGILELNAFLHESRKNIENSIKTIKENAASKDSTRKARSVIKQAEEKIESLREEIKTEEQRDVIAGDQKLAEGCRVKINSLKKRGIIVREHKKNVWMVETGSVRLPVPAYDLTVLKDDSSPAASIEVAASSSGDKPVMELDVRGFRMDDALNAVQIQIDRAIISGLKEFSVIHGKGEGILRSGIHDLLRDSREVADFHFSHPETGGFGKTIVKLK